MMDDPLFWALGVLVGLIGVGMEAVRPALRRRNIQNPAIIDEVLGVGGLVFTAAGFLSLLLLVQYLYASENFNQLPIPKTSLDTHPFTSVLERLWPLTLLAARRRP